MIYDTWDQWENHGFIDREMQKRKFIFFHIEYFKTISRIIKYLFLKAFILKAKKKDKKKNINRIQISYLTR